MTRMPQIGDSVRRTVDGKIVFEGYLSTVDGDCCGVVTPAMRAWDSEVRQWDEEHIEFVPTLFLVRAMGGWQWAPFDGRPQVGDRLKWNVKFKPWNVFEIVSMDDTRIDCIRRRGGADISHGHVTLDASKLALAIAGLEEWDWEPARWSKPPRGPKR